LKILGFQVLTKATVESVANSGVSLSKFTNDKDPAAK
jgi:hypothetical protein